MMRAASALLIAVLMTTSVISGTFAKYVSQDSATDSARVAMWGVEFVTTVDDNQTLFVKEYAHNTTGHKGTFSVYTDTDDLVAPGTSSNAYTFQTIGTPEVSYQVTFAADDSTMKTVFLAKDDAFNPISPVYYPVVFTITVGDTTTSLTSTPSDQSVTGLVNAIKDFTYYYDVTTEHYYISKDGGSTWTDFGNTVAPTLTISWNWEYNVDPDTDAMDTILGNLAVDATWYDSGSNTLSATTDYSLEVALDVTATATQLD